MNILYIVSLSFLLVGCQSSFLDVKPSTQSVVPITLNDFESLLHDANTFRVMTPIAINLIGSDEYYVLDGSFGTYTSDDQWRWHKNAYLWKKEIYTGQELYTDWSNGYKRILQANVVLDGLEKIKPDVNEKKRWNHVKGMALFHRAFAYYCLAQVYCPVYRDAESAKLDLGLPLRKKADPTLKIARSNLVDTYSFILDDLHSVVELLPKSTLQETKMDPTTGAGHALLTRVYMQMGDYTSAEQNARACLQSKNELLDYNLLDENLLMPFPVLGESNSEVLFFNIHMPVSLTTVGYMNVAADYIDLYEEGDLRKKMFFSEFKGLPFFKGGYSGIAYSSFAGIALDEVYLNLAECLARRGAVEQALDYLNKLRENRFVLEKFMPYGGLNQDETLLKVLEERKRQLYFRGLRWEDLRRLNKESKFQTSIKRVISGETYMLEPSSPLWTWPIPPTALLNGGYKQNSR